jgi:hypothetical protein
MPASGAGPAKIFVSYRRADAGWPARWLADRLAAQFGADVVFQDVDSIRPGDDFADEIEAAVGSCSVLLALIGPRWLAAESGTGRRLDNPQDWVRLEIEAAIRRRIRVIPVLLDGARMPATDELPPSLRELARRQAVTLSPVSLDIRSLVSVLGTALSASVAEERPSSATQVRDADSDMADMSSRAKLEAELILAKTQTYIAKIKSDTQKRTESIERDSRERHRQAMTFLTAYHRADATGQVLSLAQQIADQVIGYRRREAAGIIADAQTWAEYLERDALDWQGQAKKSVAAQSNKTDTSQRVLSLVHQTADRAIDDAHREAIEMVTDAQARAASLDRDIFLRHRQAMRLAAAPEDELNTAARVLSLAQTTVDQESADARREAATIIADARARAISPVERYAP